MWRILMNYYAYCVPFEINRRTEIVYAGCEADAIVLAQAEQIKKGNRYDDVQASKIYKCA